MCIVRGLMVLVCYILFVDLCLLCVVLLLCAVFDCWCVLFVVWRVLCIGVYSLLWFLVGCGCLCVGCWLVSFV